MVFESGRFGQSSGRQAGVGESIADHRARLARDEEELQQRRMEALAEQVSVVNSPSERIRIWERLHGLPLPRSSTHKLLRVIAVATDLQLEQVREVQRQRLSPAGGISAEVTTATVPKP
jgi:hypothetical protein